MNVIVRSSCAIAACAAASAYGQWFATELDGGDAVAIAESVIVGRTTDFKALCWLDPKNATELHPAAAATSAAFGVHDGRQVGRALIGGANHAALWFGSPESFVDLHPVGASTSIANDIYGNQQGGYAVFNGMQHAGIWSGTAASFIDLNPLGATRSFVKGMADGRQVGSAMFGGIYHAGVWSGTAISWTDIHPTGSTESAAYDTDAQTFAGFMRVGNKHACLWHGVSSGFADLNPASATESIAYGASGGSQAGFAVIDGITSACVWQGAAETHQSLHPFVDGRFTESAASDIYKDFETGFTYVVGRAWNAQEAKAVLWTLPPHEVAPTTLTVLRGSGVVGDIEWIRRSDDLRLNVNPGVVLSNSQSPVILEIVGVSPNPVISHLKMSIEASANTPSARCMVELYDFDRGRYEVLATFQSTTFDTLYEFVPTNPSRYTSASGEIKCRISYRLSGPILAFPWTSRLDWVHWRVVE